MIKVTLDENRFWILCKGDFSFGGATETFLEPITEKLQVKIYIPISRPSCIIVRDLFWNNTIK